MLMTYSISKISVGIAAAVLVTLIATVVTYALTLLIPSLQSHGISMTSP